MMFVPAFGHRNLGFWFSRFSYFGLADDSLALRT